MDYRKILEGKNKKQLEEIAENWYSRLNNLKELFYGQKDQREKLPDLMAEMTIRMMAIGQIYIKVNQPMPPKNFKPGGKFDLRIKDKLD